MSTVSTKDMSLRKQAEEVDDKLINFHSKLSDKYPDLELWSSGSVLYNSFEMGMTKKLVVKD